MFAVKTCTYATLVQEQLPSLAANQILGESIRSNTVPCIAYASYRIWQHKPQVVIFISPAGYAVLCEEEFCRLIQKAVVGVGEHEVLITMGYSRSQERRVKKFVTDVKSQKNDIYH